MLSASVTALSTAVTTLSTKLDYQQKDIDKQSTHAADIAELNSKVALLQQSLVSQREERERQSNLNKWLVGTIIASAIGIIATTVTIISFALSHVH